MSSNLQAPMSVIQKYRLGMLCLMIASFAFNYWAPSGMPINAYRDTDIDVSPQRISTDAAAGSPSQATAVVEKGASPQASSTPKLRRESAAHDERTSHAKGQESATQIDTRQSITPSTNNADDGTADVVRTKWWEPFVNSTACVFHPYPAFMWSDKGGHSVPSNHTQASARHHAWCSTLGTDDHFKNSTATAAQPGDSFMFDQPKLPMTGILYVKSHKASSSTCEGVNERIAHQVAKRQFAHLMASTANHTLASRPSNPTDAVSESADSYRFSRNLVCPHQNRHEFANGKWHGANRKPAPRSLLWTMVRQPSNRDLSQIFHLRVSRMKMEPTDDNIISILREPRMRGTQARYLLPKQVLEEQVAPSVVRDHPERVAHIVQTKILRHYDFIGVTERMVESLAVMTLLWDLEPADVVVLSAKRAGKYDAGGKNHVCTKIQPVQRSAAVQDFMKSYDAYEIDHADFLLYAAVQESLDRTIASLGVHRVQQRVDEIRRLQSAVEEKCEASAVFPCSPDGTYQGDASAKNCYVQDAGCGYPCVDALLEQRGGM